MPKTHAPISNHDFSARFTGCLLGGAVGDALGAPIEFLSRAQIFQKFPPAGVTTFVERNQGGIVQGQITDDTQMTLFTAEGLLNANPNLCSLTSNIFHAYQRWMVTQGECPPPDRTTTDGLLSFRELHRQRAPGATCLNGMNKAIARGQHGTLADPVTRSPTCGGLMRVAPIGLAFSADPMRAYEVAVAAAAITHGHPDAYSSAGYFAALLALLAQGFTLKDALNKVLGVLKLSSQPHNRANVIKFISHSRSLAYTTKSANEAEAISRIGEGWTAVSALGIAIYCALRHPANFTDAVLLAVNITGDSDTTGSLVGQIMGTLHGLDAIPAHWHDNLELYDLIEDTALDLYTERDYFAKVLHCKEKSCTLHYPHPSSQPSPIRSRAMQIAARPVRSPTSKPTPIRFHCLT